MMKGGAQAALAIGVGYILGRRRKMRLATMLAATAATGGLAKLGPVALKRGVKLLDSTEIGGALAPQVTDIVSTIRGELLDAGKAAAAAAVTSRVDSLSESLHDRAEALRDPEAAVAGAGRAAGRAGETAGRHTVGRVRRRSRGADVDDIEPDGDDQERRNDPSRREQTRSRRTPSEEDEGREPEPEDEYEEYEDEDEEPEADEPEDDLDELPADEAEDIDAEDADDIDAEDEEEEPAPRRRRTTRSPVTRTGR
jgi:hypothetical protein